MVFGLAGIATPSLHEHDDQQFGPRSSAWRVCALAGSMPAMLFMTGPRPLTTPWSEPRPLCPDDTRGGIRSRCFGSSWRAVRRLVLSGPARPARLF